jgi:RimJ/RimL family protein N-acetyltransferase
MSTTAWVRETERLLARAPQAGDLDGYLELFRDPAVEEWLRPKPLHPFREAEVRTMLEGDEEHWAVHGFGPWAIFELDGGGPVGRGGLKWTEVEGRLAVEMPWAIRSDRWGRGYATEAARAAVEWARSMEWEEVVALVLPHNAASRRVAENAGLRQDGETLHAGLDHLVFRLKL